MAALTGTKVISVQYRLAPQFPFPAAVEDSAAVYSAELKTTLRARSPSMEPPSARSCTLACAIGSNEDQWNRSLAQGAGIAGISFSRQNLKKEKEQGP